MAYTGTTKIYHYTSILHTAKCYLSINGASFIIQGACFQLTHYSRLQCVWFGQQCSKNLPNACHSAIDWWGPSRKIIQMHPPHIKNLHLDNDRGI